MSHSSDDIYCPSWLKSPQYGTCDLEHESVLDLISELLQSERDFYQQLQVMISLFEELFTEENEVKLFVDDLRVMSKYSHRFLTTVKSVHCSREPFTRVEETKIGSILNDTMFMHEEYRMCLISQMVKFDFKKLVLGDKKRLEPMLYGPISRILRLKAILKLLIDISKGLTISKLEFEVFQIQLCYMKISKVIEFSDNYPPLSDWVDVVNFDKECNTLVSRDESTEREDLRLLNSEAGKQPTKQNFQPREIDVKLLIEFVQEYRELSRIRDSLVEYIARIVQFTDTQLSYCKLWHQFFSLYEYGGKIVSPTTSLYSYESYINIWAQRTRETAKHRSYIEDSIISKLNRILSIMVIVLSSMQNSNHWYKSFHIKLDQKPMSNTAVGAENVRKIIEILHSQNLKQEIVRSFFQEHLRWMKAIIGQKSLEEFNNLGEQRLYGDIIASYNQTVDLTATALGQFNENMY